MEMENYGIPVPAKTMEKVVWGYNREQYKNIEKKPLATEKILVFYDDDTAEIFDLTNLSDKEKSNLINEVYETVLAANLEDHQKIFCYTDSKVFQEAESELQPVSMEGELEPVEEEKSKTKVIPAWVKVAGAGLGGVALGAAIAAGANAIHDMNVENENNIDNTLGDLGEDLPPEENENYGLYHYDLSKMSGLEQYNNEIPDSLQKQTSNRLFNVLQKFNQQFQLVDSDVQQLGGFTIEQVIALDAYANSNLYSSEDYIRNFGLYDFSNVTSDFQQATLQAGAYLANPEIDGTALADVFQDETVKNLYLKSLEYRSHILNAKDSKEKKQAVKDYENFLASQTDTTSENFVDYSEHPGMAFVTPAIVMALNYHNVSLNSEVVSDMLIIGNDGSLSDVNYLSKVDTICPKAETKLEEAVNLVKDVEHAMIATNQTIKAYNAAETQKAQTENRNPVLLQLEYQDLDELISNTLCDQNQINELMNRELDKTNQHVTAEDQKVVMENAINISRSLQEKGKGHYKDEKTAKLAEQLQKPGDTVVVTQEEVKIDTPAEKSKLEEAVPEQVEQAKEELNQSQGLIPNETPEEKQAVEEQIQKDIVATEQEGVNYYNQVVSYYETYGDVAGIPSNLQDAYNNLGASTFDLAKQTGVARFMTNDQNKTFGGEYTPAPGFEDVDTNATQQQNQPTNFSMSSETPAPEQNVSSTPSEAPAPEQMEPSTPSETPFPEQSVPSTSDETPAPEQTEPSTSDEMLVPGQVSSMPGESSNPTPSDPQAGSEFGGETQINPEFGDVDLGDVSTDPNSMAIGSVVDIDIDSLSDDELWYAVEGMEDVEFEDESAINDYQVEDSGYTK